MDETIFCLVQLSVNNIDFKKKFCKAVKESTQLKQNINVPRCVLALFEAKDKKPNARHNNRPIPHFPE